MNHTEKRLLFVFEGVPFKENNNVIRQEDNGCVQVIRFSDWTIIENARKHAKKDMEQVKNWFNVLLKANPQFHSKVLDLRIEFHVYYDDIGKAGILLCSEIDGEVTSL